MNRLALGLAAAVMQAAGVSFAATDAVYYGVKYSTQGEVVPGEWTCQFDRAKAYAEDHDIPLVVFWGNSGCPHCVATEQAMATGTFTDWQQSRGLAMIFTVGGVTPLADNSKAYQFCRNGSMSIPRMAVYWKGHRLADGTQEKVQLNTPDYTAARLIALIEKYVANYEFSGSTAYVPGDAAADGVADADGKALVRLAAGELYRFEGIDAAACAEALEAADDSGVHFRALVSGDVALTVAGGEGAAFSYQRWRTVEDDRVEPGRAMVTRAGTHWAKAGTVYVRAGEGAEVYVKRVEASDGPVGVELKSSFAGVAFAADDPSDLEEVYDAKTRKTKTLLRWANRDMSEKRLVVKGVPAGKTAKVTLAAYGGFGVVSASNAVTVAAVADGAPGFSPAEASATVYRYVACSNLCPVAGAAGGRLTFAKVSGALPSGLTVAHDAAAGAMAVFGVPTANPGAAGAKRYEAVYQVTEARPTGVGARTEKVPGLTVRLVYDLVDPAVAGGAGGAALNGFYAKARTYADVPVVDAAAGALAGVLQVTVPPTGRASAKLLCSLGTVSFSAKGFSSVGEDGAFGLALASKTRACPGASLAVRAGADGGLEVRVSGLGAELRATAAAPAWSAAHPAERFRGQYTVAMPVRAGANGSPEVEEGVVGLAPLGTPHLTLKLASKSDWSAGRVKWAGALADGTAVSGTAVLTEVAEDGEVVAAHLPVAKQSKTDFFSALLRIDAQDGSVAAPTMEATTCLPLWMHQETAKALADAGFTVRYDLYGGLYTAPPDGTYALTFDGPMASEQYGELTPPAVVPALVVAAGKARLSGDNPGAVKLSLSANGVVSGSFLLSYADGARKKTVSAAYRGVVTPGWDGCPVLNGAWTVKDKYRKVAVKRGMAVIGE